MNGAVELFKACKKHGVKPILGPRGVLRRRPHGPRGQDRAQPPHAARARTTRASATSRSCPAPASSRACTAASPASTWSCSSRHADGRHRAHRLPGLALEPPDRRRPPRRRPRAPRRARPGLRARERLLRGPAQRHRRAGPGQRGDREVRPRDGPPARRDRRRALPAPRGLRPPRGAAVRADEVDAGRAEDVLRHQRVLPEELGGDGAVVRRLARGARLDAGDRRALRRRGRARRPADPALRDARRAGGARLPARARRGRPAPPLRRPDPGRRAASAPTWSSA